MILDWHCADGAEPPHTSVNEVSEGPDDETCIAVFYPIQGDAVHAHEERALLFVDAMVKAGLAVRPDAAWQARWYPEGM